MLIPSIAFFESLTAISKIGNNIGKLSTAISAVLLLALETIPETKVKTPEKPIEAKCILVNESNEFVRYL